MPIFIRTKRGENYRLKGERIRLSWRIGQFFGWLVRFVEAGSGNTLHIAGREISHFAEISQESIDAAQKAQAEAQAQDRGEGKRIIEPTCMIPRSRPH